MPTPDLNTQIDLPPLSIRADFRPGSVNLDARTVEVVFSTGAPVQRVDWVSGQRYIETLSLKPASVRLDRLNGGAPFLNAHSADGLGDMLGVVVAESARIAQGKAIATVRLSQRDAVAPIWQDIRDGIIRNVSVGYRVHKYEQTEPKDGQPMLRHAVDWEPYEISAVPMPADTGAHVRAEIPASTNPCVLLPAPKEGQMADNPTPTPPPADAPPPTNLRDPGAPIGLPPEAPKPQPPTDREVAMGAERARVQGMIRANRNGGLPAEFADRHIEAGTSLETFQGLVLEEVGRLGRQTLGPREGPSAVQVEELGGTVIHLRRGITNALLHRVNPSTFPLDDFARQYGNITLIRAAEYCLQARGHRVTALSSMELMRLALETRSIGYTTTSDFASILADVANKTLRSAYDEAPQTFLPISRVVEVPDFKNINRMQLGEAPTLDLVGEHGEFQRGTIGDAKETYKLSTYGKVFGITRQALVNDDLNAFARVPMLFGRAARQRESQLAWDQITTNPTMGDSVALFHATHANLDTVAAAINIGPLGIGRAGMRNQKALDGNEFLNIAPRYLIVPPSKETVANQYTTQITPALGGSVNPFAGVLSVIAEPRLEANSSTAWYLAASTDQIDILELAYLTGQIGPTVETRAGFEISGVEIKCQHDVAAKVIDWRGLWKNPGV